MVGSAPFVFAGLLLPALVDGAGALVAQPAITRHVTTMQSQWRISSSRDGAQDECP
jgi:hypothetical protein